jgi:O-antigen ligase/polysaccharide polymerase Wzy-like membrane protein
MIDSKNQKWSLILLLVAALLGSQAALSVGAESVFYVIAVATGCFYVACHPVEAIWVGFFLLGLTAQVYPVQLDELGTSVRGDYRPYIAVLILLGVAILIGLWARTRPSYANCTRGHVGMRGPIIALVSVLFLTLAYSYFWEMRTSTLADVIRECSGWMIFFFFLMAGYRILPSLSENQRAFARLRLAVFVFSPFFIAKYIYLWVSVGSEPATAFAYSQRDAVFFSGIVLTLLLVERLAAQVKEANRNIWLGVAVLLLAVFFCGSRAVLGSVLLVTLCFVLVWHARTRLRWGLLAAGAAIVILIGLSLDPSSLFDSQESLLGSVTRRFVFSPTEDTSFLARASQMVAIADAIQRNPVLGNGMLATYSFFDPLFGWKDTTFVDTGLGYLLMKTGLLGTGVFIWFAAAWLAMVRRLRKRAHWGTLAPLVCFAFYLAFTLFEPSFFVFQFSWFIGIVAGGAIYRSSCISLPEFRSVASAVPESAS